MPDFPVNETVEWENISGDEIIPSSRISVSDSCIYLRGKLDGYAVQRVARNDGHLLGQIVTLGSGPGEVTNPTGFSVWDNERRMDMYDNGTKRLYSYILENGEAKFIGDNAYEDNVVPAIDEIYRVDNQTIMIDQRELDADFKRKLTFVNNDGETVFYYDKLPENEDASNVILKHNTHKAFSFSPDGKHLAYGTTFGGVLELFDIKPDRLESKYAICMFPLTEQQLANNSMALAYACATGKDKVNGIRALTATNDYIVAAYSIDRYDDFSEIGIWDWSGKPIKNISTDKTVLSIDVSPDGKYLYGVCSPEYGEYHIGRIPLNLPNK